MHHHQAPPPHIVVVGSINMDLVARMARLPRLGETVSGESFQTIPGGKGANQAVAAARLSARVTMIGRLGDDPFAVVLRNGLNEAGIDTKYVFDTFDCSSGVALIGVETSGANCITVIPAANYRLTESDVERCDSVIASADALIVQLETPIPTIIAAVTIAKKHRVLTILDPAPAPAASLPPDLFAVDILSPNQTEAEALTGIVVNDWDSAERAARDLKQKGARNVVMKLGAMGALVLSEDGSIQCVDTVKARIIDTTAAGDAFTAAMTVTFAAGRSLIEAVQIGCLAGTLACTRIGAQPAMPTREDLESWNRSMGNS